MSVVEDIETVRRVSRSATGEDPIALVLTLGQRRELAKNRPSGEQVDIKTNDVVAYGDIPIFPKEVLDRMVAVPGLTITLGMKVARRGGLLDSNGRPDYDEVPVAALVLNGLATVPPDIHKEEREGD